MRVAPPFPANTITLWRRRPRPLERLSGSAHISIVWAGVWCLGRFELDLFVHLALLILVWKSAGIAAWRASEYERLHRLARQRHQRGDR